MILTSISWVISLRYYLMINKYYKYINENRVFKYDRVYNKLIGYITILICGLTYAFNQYQFQILNILQIFAKIHQWLYNVG